MRFLLAAILAIGWLMPASLSAQSTLKDFNLTSPDGITNLRITAGSKLQWSVSRHGQVVLAPSAIGLQLQDGTTLGENIRTISATKEKKEGTITALHYKKDVVTDNYNQLTISCNKGDYGVIFRAYNDGIAYRFFTRRTTALTIHSEIANFNFTADDKAWIPYVNDPQPDLYTTSFENFYQSIRLSQFKKDTLAFLPVLVDLGDGKKAAILEADLEDYPGMFLEAGKESTTGLTGKFAPYSLEERQGGHNQLQSFVTRRADYIAVTEGNRSYPWRIVILSDADKELADNDMVYRLASPSRLTDTAWIKPGKVAWDWWNDWNISHVDFRAGINTATYKYYIDFAAASHIGYILLDEGWADSKDIMQIVPEVDLQAIIDYGRQKGVGVWLWGGWLPLDRKLDEALGHYAQMGIKGFKIDFMNRDDQKMVQYYYRVAKAAAGYRLMVDFHGAYKPTGLQRTYPNVMNFEGVRGMENAKWSNADFPEYDVTIPYIRMLAGPLDYTPGAMKNANKANFRAINGAPMSQGTRCHQLAMYIVYEAPFSMLADNPTNYLREPESVAFIAGVPTSFDQTLALEGQVGQYIAIARRKGNDWYLAAMSDWSPRDITLDLSFLGPGHYEAEIFRDGINADRDGTDYKKEKKILASGDKLSIHLAPGGGWAAKIVPAPASSRIAPRPFPAPHSSAGNAWSPQRPIIVPDPSDLPLPAIAVNQLGFYPQAPKIAVLTGVSETPPSIDPAASQRRISATATSFYILSSNSDTVYSGRLGPLLSSTNSRMMTRLADFSKFRKEGLYVIAVPGMANSYPFRIGRQVLGRAVAASLKGYYYQRSAMALDPSYAGQWSRAAGHPDTSVLIHPSAATAKRPAGFIISATGGWYDAGDYNKYVVNSGITMGTLLDAYEDFPSYYDTLHTNIPPLASSVTSRVPAAQMHALPDILNEAVYNLRWMLTMQDPDDGGVYNKCTNAAFDGMVMPGVTKDPRYVVQKGTAATLDFAAVMAQAARILKKFQRPLPGLSDTCLRAATRAWQWAVQHPAQAYDQNAMNNAWEPKITTGGYGDSNFTDEWFWAAVELMISSGNEPGVKDYQAMVQQGINTPLSLPSWSNVQMMGIYTLLRYKEFLPSLWQPAILTVQQHLFQMADGYIGKISSNAFQTVMGNSPRDFVWGSNSVAANQGMLLVNAWLQHRDQKYIEAASGNLDYLLGRNATGYCFVTGLGTRSPQHPHHRPSVADGIQPPVPGLLVGGPNPGRQDRQVYPFTDPEIAYIDQDKAYASNEIAINWNAPFVYLAGALEALQYQDGYSNR